MRMLRRGLLELGQDVPTQKPRDAQVIRSFRNLVNILLPLSTRPRFRSASRLAAQVAGRRFGRQNIRRGDIVHYVGTGWDLAGFAVERAARRAGAVMTCWPAVHPGTWGDAPLDVDLYNRVDAVFVQSDFEQEHLQSLGVTRPQFIRCGCGVNLPIDVSGERFRAQHRLHNRRLVLFVGRKSRSKGYHALREAIGVLVAAGHPVTLVSIGNAVEPPYSPLPPETDVDLGVASEEAKQDAFAACDLFVLPSSAESFGIVYLEAWAHGKAVICGEAPASRELVARHAGGISSRATPEELAKQIAILLTDERLRHDMGAAGQSAVVREYSWNQVAQTHVDAWQSLLNEKGLR